MKITQDTHTYRMEFDSVAELIEKVEADGGRKDYCSDRLANPTDYLGLDIDSYETLKRLAVSGWTEAMPDALAIAQETVRTVEAQLPRELGFSQTFDVAGSVVDIDRYLTDVPECMIDFPLVEIVKAGRVITLCAGLTASASVSWAALNRRGTVIVALALALADMGYGIEIWADITGTQLRPRSTATQKAIIVRVPIKLARDEIDPARLMYALAHPSFMRFWGFGAYHLAPEKFQKAIGVRAGYGGQRDPAHDLPDGTIYTPKLTAYSGAEDAAELLQGYLHQIDLI